MSLFWEVVVSNAVVASGLAIGVGLLSRFWKNAAAVHLLWVLVLVKLFTPPVISVPVAANWLREVVHSPDLMRVGGESQISPVGEVPAERETKSSDLIDKQEIKNLDPAGNSGEISGFGQWAAQVVTLPNVLLVTWLVGSTGIGVWYYLRVRRFKNYLHGTVEAAPADIEGVTTELARGLGLKRKLSVMMTSRSLPPLVWSVGRRARVILPAALFERLDDDGRRAILAHELAHVSRRDDLVRLLELAATTVFWWHPVVWWACRQMRELEDQCCDSRVVEQAPQQARTYAEALVDTLEFLSEQPRMFVPLPTAIQCSNSLSRRIQMLRGKQTNRLNIVSAGLIVALAAVPLAITLAAEKPQAGNGVAGSAAVISGRVTDEAGAPLADARIRVAYPATRMWFLDTEPNPGVQQWETKTDADGKYRMELPRIIKPGKISVDVMKPGYRTAWGTLMRGGDTDDVDITPGKAAEKSFTLHPALYLKGIVVDEKGKPIPGAEIMANANTAKASGGVERVKSTADGTFEIFNYSIKPKAFENEPAKGEVHFFEPNYVTGKIDDIYALPENQRESLRIVLPGGYKISGTVVDTAGKPVANLMIKATYESDWHLRKATLTDAQGKFILRGLPEEAGTLSAHSIELEQKTKLPITLDHDQTDLKVQLQPIALVVEPKKVTVLGMQLTDLTPELRTAYDLLNEHGVLVLDPGKDSERFGIGKLEKGDLFWMVGEKQISGVREFVEQLLAEAAAQKTDEPKIRVVYGLTRLDFDGTNTQYMKLTKADLEELRSVLKQLSDK